jgi:oligosaccharide repeat unit polymerase
MVLSLINKFIVIIVKILFLLLILLFFQLLIIDISAWILLSSILFVLLLDISKPLLFKNFFLFYTFLFFIISGEFYFSEEKSFLLDFFVCVTFFMLGYKLVRLKEQKEMFDDIYLNYDSLYYVAYVLNICLIFYKIFLVGFSGYLGGDFFVLSKDSYGTRDNSMGFYTIIKNFVDIYSLSLVILHQYAIFVKKKHANYLPFIILLLIVPMLSLERFRLVQGIVMGLLIFSLTNDKRGEFKPKHFIILLLSIITIVFSAISINNIRSKGFYGENQSESSNPEFAFQILGELNNTFIYKEIKDGLKSGKYSYQYGRTLLLPLALKVVPRSFFPEKPLNTGGEISKSLDLFSFENGFMIPSAIYGDLYYNFGYFGLAIGCLLLGYISNVLDSGITSGNKSKVIISIFVMNYHFYSFLRNDISNSVSLIIFTFIVIFFLKNINKIKIII